ncbi:hypothetical protein HL666_12575 [Bradyrhizobium sp. 83002]|uniref:hypothetical protein n=1 Tax=Bradyrhizobium aeschynomenes TaxID=2734909 RepID=UPI001552E4CC|nr:hypothetical protein [Bradyrhizobium aeschynomenes]NPU11597.1 hypothetical protein [Bradyrhizobium aeschynomenes]
MRIVTLPSAAPAWGIATSVRIIRDQSGLAMRRLGAAQAVVVMAEQLIDRAKILQHLDVMLAERTELNLIDPDLPFSMEKALLQLLEHLQGQLLFDIRHGFSPTLFAQDAPDRFPRIGHFFRPVCRRPKRAFDHACERSTETRNAADTRRRAITQPQLAIIVNVPGLGPLSPGSECMLAGFRACDLGEREPPERGSPIKVASGASRINEGY